MVLITVMSTKMPTMPATMSRNVKNAELSMKCPHPSAPGGTLQGPPGGVFPSQESYRRNIALVALP
jgi:hypothetical protein